MSVESGQSREKSAESFDLPVSHPQYGGIVVPAYSEDIYLPIFRSGVESSGKILHKH